MNEYETYRRYINRYVKIIKKMNERDYFYSGVIVSVVDGDNGVLLTIKDDKINDTVMMSCKDIIIIPGVKQ